MTKKNKNRLTALVLFLSSGLYLWFAWSAYQTQFIELDQLDKYEGIVVDRGTTQQKAGKRMSTVFYIQLEGLDETLGIYRMGGGYYGLVQQLQPGDLVTVYYISRPALKKVNIDLVQLEKDGRVIIDANEYKKKESALIYICLIGIVLSVGIGIYYLRKNTLSKRLRAKED